MTTLLITTIMLPLKGKVPVNNSVIAVINDKKLCMTEKLFFN